MAGSLSLAYMGTTVTLSPLIRVRPDRNVDTGAITKTGITGKIYAYKRFSKQKHFLEFNNVSKTDADYLNLWCQNKVTCTYTPDTDTAGTTYNVKIMNEGNPFDWMPNTPPDTLFEGSLLLREV